MLDLAAAGVADPAELRWLDPPPEAGYAQARELLQLLGAVDDHGRITPHGNAMADLGAHPRLAHMLLRASASGPGAVSLAATLVALLEERDLLHGAEGPPFADVQLRLDAIARDVEELMLGGATVDRGLVLRVREVMKEWQKRMERQLGSRVRAAPDPGVGVSAGLLLALAYPDRVAQRRGAPGRFLLRNGRGVTLPVHDPLAHAEWIVAVQIDDAGRDGRVMLAAALDVNDLMAESGEQIITRDVIEWRDDLQSVTARRRTMLGALVLKDAAMRDAAPDAVRVALLEGLRRLGVNALPWSESGAAVRRRLAFVQHHDAAWPDVSDATLAATLDVWLAPLLGDAEGLADLARIDFGAALCRLLTWEQRRQLDVWAPERIAVPSGSMIAVDYNDPGAPALAVRLQEVFGMTETPVLLHGLAPVTMQLLSPAYRPVQVTRDLASFWRTGYFDVRKDLRGRYPKHHWPEDPLAAEPVRGAKRRK